MKSGQAALDFLMTYGWAIGSVITVIAALTYYGVFDTTQFLAEKCELSLGVNCQDILISSNTNGIIRLNNGLGSKILIRDLILTSNDNQIRCKLLDSHKGTELERGEAINFYLSDCSLSELPIKKMQGHIELSYQNLQSKFDNTLHGKVVTKIEGTPVELT